MMKILELFKGLTKEYYFRQLFFGGVLFALSTWLILKGDHSNYLMIVFFAINTVLYPYARFAYERVTGFLLGDNVLFANIIVFTVLKFVSMLLCWYFAIFITPVGLLLIHLHQKKLANETQE